MEAQKIPSYLSSRLCNEVEVRQVSDDRYAVVMPFYDDTGDGITIRIVKKNDQWYITDEATTLMHLSTSTPIERMKKGKRALLLRGVLSRFGIKRQGTELRKVVPDAASVGFAVYQFAQGLLRLHGMDLLSGNTRKRTDFAKEVRSLAYSVINSERITPDWHDPEHDSQELYTVDAKINSIEPPLFLYGLGTDGQTKDATIALQQFDTWGIENRSFGVFRDIEDLTTQTAEKFLNVSNRYVERCSSDYDRKKVIRILKQEAQEEQATF